MKCLFISVVCKFMILSVCQINCSELRASLWLFKNLDEWSWISFHLIIIYSPWLLSGNSLFFFICWSFYLVEQLSLSVMLVKNMLVQKIEPTQNYIYFVLHIHISPHQKLWCVTSRYLFQFCGMWDVMKYPSSYKIRSNLDKDIFYVACQGVLIKYGYLGQPKCSFFF